MQELPFETVGIDNGVAVYLSYILRESDKGNEA